MLVGFPAGQTIVWRFLPTIHQTPSSQETSSWTFVYSHVLVILVLVSVTVSVLSSALDYIHEDKESGQKVRNKGLRNFHVIEHVIGQALSVRLRAVVVPYIYIRWCEWEKKTSPVNGLTRTKRVGSTRRIVPHLYTRERSVFCGREDKVKSTFRDVYGGRSEICTSLGPMYWSVSPPRCL